MALPTKHLPRMRNLLRNYGPRAVIQVLIAIANFVLIQAVARVLPTAEFGRYSLLLAVNAMALALLYQPVCDGLMRFLHGATREGQRPQIQRSAAVFGLAAGGLACVLYAGALGLAVLFHAVPQTATTDIIIATPCFFTLYCLVAMVSSYFNSDARYGWYLFSGFGTPVMGAVAAVLAVRYLGADALSVVIAQLVVYLAILTGVFGARLKRVSNLFTALLRAPNAEERSSDLQFLAFVLPIPVLYLANYAATFGDRWLVASFFSLQDLGRYGYLFVLTTNVMFAAFNVYSATTFLHAVERLSDAGTPAARKATVRRFFWMCAGFPLLFAPLLPVYLFFERETVHLVFGAAASVPHGSLALVLVSAIFLGGAMQLSTLANLLKRQRELIVPRWTSVALMLGAIAIYHPSLIAVCAELAVVNFLYCIVVAAIVWRMTNDPNDTAEPASPINQLV